MSGFFDSLTQRLADSWRQNAKPPAVDRRYRCQCERPVFFRNSQCLGCQSPLGYVPEQHTLRALEEVPSERHFVVVGDDANPRQRHRRCGNLDTAAACNWLVPVEDPNPLCVACRLNRTIPDLSVAENGVLWGSIERAKRRLIAQLLELGLPVHSKVDQDPVAGLMFDFLRSPPEGPRVLTGHAGGIITLNIEEADDAVREKMRTELHEPYRTLLGHFRHEIGHYYWDRLIAGTRWLKPFRELFGDEQVDYQAALKRNYETGPSGDWAERHVSSYASVHPWEDWAETWAHYLHTLDALNTALGFGLEADELDFQADPFTAESLYDPQATDSAQFLSWINSWVELTALLNELARSMGQPDLYPFVLSKSAVKKLHFIHLVVLDARSTPVP